MHVERIIIISKALVSLSCVKAAGAEICSEDSADSMGVKQHLPEAELSRSYSLSELGLGRLLPGLDRLAILFSVTAFSA